MHSQLITIQEKEAVLLILPPDWSSPVRASVRIATEVVEGLTGLQERRAEHLSPRILLRYMVLLQEGSLQTVRSLIGGLEDRLVAIPFWPDLFCTTLNASGEEVTDWNARILNAQVNVGWNGVYQNVEVTEGSNPPNRQMRGALLFGRLGKSTFKAFSDNLAELEISFSEDSPWAFRAEPNAPDPGSWSDNWSINWRFQPEQSERILLEYNTLGRGRQSASEGTADAHFWQQSITVSLQRPEIGKLFAFYCARKGGVEPFALPSALQPSVSTSTAPHEFTSANGRVRFSENELKIDWITASLAELRIVVEQQIEAPSITQSAPSFAFLYLLRYEGTELTLTDWEAPISANSRIWQPARIEHGRIRQSLKPQNEECEVTAYLEDVPLVEPLVRMELETPVYLEIYELDLPTGLPQMLFTGSIQHARAKGKRVKLKSAAFGGALRRRVPRFQWSVSCNHTLFSHGCVRRRAAAMDPQNWRTTGTYKDQWADPKLILHNITFPTSPPPPHHYFAGGWLETGSGASRQVREILASWNNPPDGELHLLLSRGIRTDQLQPGQLFHVYPGCDGQYSTCIAKFNNKENFGGFPYLPAWIEQAPAGAFPKTGK